MSDLSNPIFLDETKAREWLEARVWPKGRLCPRCDVIDQSTLMQGKSHRPGLYQCNACRERLASPWVPVSAFAYSLNKWLAATHLMMASKKGMSALEIGRLLGLSKKLPGSSAIGFVAPFAKPVPTCSAAKARPSEWTTLS